MSGIPIDAGYVGGADVAGADVRERLNYLQFSEADFQNLRRFHALTDRHVDHIVGSFYDHLQQFPAAEQFVGNDLVQKKLLSTLKQYLLTLGTGARDDVYFEDRHRIGVVHERLGLSLQSYLGAYASIIDRYGERLREAPGIDTAELTQLLTTLFRAMLLDAIIVTESYYEATTTRLESLLTELGETQQSLEQLSRTDELTQVANRRYLFEAVETELYRCSRYGRDFVLLMMDLDHFKQLNDRYGHQFGDRALATVAGIIRDTVRPADIVGRYGGEEFAVGVVECDADTAQDIADRVRLKIGRSPISAGEHASAVTVSVGLAAWNRGESLDSLMSRADAALYDAKAQGRNRVAVAASQT